MHPKLAIFSSALLFLLMPLAQGQTADTVFSYTLQVASFPNATLAAQYADRLSHAGEPVGFGTVDLPGRGQWTRIYIGSFQTIAAARKYGDALISRQLIAEYIVKTARELQSLGRPHTVNRTLRTVDSHMPQATTDSAAPLVDSKKAVPHPTERASAAISSTSLSNSTASRPALMVAQPRAVNNQARRWLTQPVVNRQLVGLLAPLPDVQIMLPAAYDLRLSLAPVIDAAAIPRPDPVHLAFSLINGNRSGHGGLWVSGDCEEALARLRWIIGDKPELIDLDDKGAVRINRKRLAEAAGANAAAPTAAPVRIAEYISANEGLFLLVQLTQGAQRYLLHIGRRAPSLNGVIDVFGSVNLDNNYDSRINPYRRNGRKLDIERPPKGFDSLIAINPAARWFNLRAQEFVPAAHITFHELAEAHAKLALNLDYLEQDNRPGAHNIALEREARLKAQRPSVNVVLTLGANRLFKSEEEVRHFYTQTGDAAGLQR